MFHKYSYKNRYVLSWRDRKSILGGGQSWRRNNLQWWDECHGDGSTVLHWPEPNESIKTDPMDTKSVRNAVCKFTKLAISWGHCQIFNESFKIEKFKINYFSTGRFYNLVASRKWMIFYVDHFWRKTWQMANKTANQPRNKKIEKMAQLYKFITFKFCVDVRKWNRKSLVKYKTDLVQER